MPQLSSGYSERGENFALHPKIRMPHVRALHSVGKAQSEAAKVIGSHFAFLLLKLLHLWY